MSKHTKKNRSNRSAFKLEALEQRQLLASIVAGSGYEVDGATNIKLANGNTYDQVLLTGSTITVTADAGQVTRVDFLDADGDIVRAELSGAGQLKIDLADFKAAAVPTEYATTTQYVQGKASFQISGSNETTNFTLYSLGSANVNGGASNAIFAGGTKDGGNNWANVSRLVIEDDGSVLGNAFGGIRAGNAVFADSTGATGIAAPNIQFQGPIIIGGIFESGTAVGLLNIGQFSANKTVTVVGTDLKDARIDSSNITKLTVGSGQSSMGTIVETKELHVNAFNSFNGVEVGVNGDDQNDVNDKAVAATTYTSSALTVTLNGDTTADQLTSYAGRYLNDVIVEESFNKAFSAKLIGNVTVKGDLDISITSNLGIGNISVEKGVASGASDGQIIVTAGSVGNVTFGTGVDIDTGYDAAEVIKASGNVGTITFGGEVSAAAEQLVEATKVAGIVGTKITATGVLVNATGDVGNLTFSDEIALSGSTLTGKSIGNISGKKVTLGAITGSGGSVGTITAAGDLVVGVITSDKNVGAISATGTVSLASITTDNEGDVGAITAGKTLTLNGMIDSAGSIGAITSAETLTVSDGVEAVKAIGDIKVTGSNKSLVIGADGYFKAGTTIGAVTVASGAITSAHAGGVGEVAEFEANQIGSVSVTMHKDTATALLSDVVFRATGSGASIGNITLDATAKSAGVIADSHAASTTEVTGTGFSSTGNIGNITIRGTDGGKLLGAADDVLLFRAGSSNMGAIAQDSAADAVVSIGNVEIEANLTSGATGVGQGLIIASGVTPGLAGEFVKGVTAITGAPRDGRNGSIGSVTLTELGGAGVTGFTGNALANPGASPANNFSGGSVIIANAIGEVTVDAGDSVTMAATSTARKGALDTNTDGVFGGAAGEGDLYVIVL